MVGGGGVGGQHVRSLTDFQIGLLFKFHALYFPRFLGKESDSGPVYLQGLHAVRARRRVRIVGSG